MNESSQVDLEVDGCIKLPGKIAANRCHSVQLPKAELGNSSIQAAVGLSLTGISCKHLTEGKTCFIMEKSLL